MITRPRLTFLYSKLAGVLFFKRTAGVVLLCATLLVFNLPAQATTPRPTIAQRTQAIAKQLECLVCENKNIEQSTMPVAEELEIIIQTRLAAGDTDKQVIDFVTREYANFVQPRPDNSRSLFFVWAAVFALLAGGGGFLLHIHKRRETATDQMLMDFDMRDRMATKIPGKPPYHSTTDKPGKDTGA